ncbi:MAG: hypothetical protein Q8K58_14160 [Acidimicrobiales bacterium]|nr:hypothetical protein [Acidimicrobiales bacterium]
MDRRAAFFALAALICAVLVPLAEEEFRTLTICVGATYLVLALASFFDHRSRPR